MSNWLVKIEDEVVLTRTDVWSEWVDIEQYKAAHKQGMSYARAQREAE